MMREGQKMIDVLLEVLYEVATGKLISFEVLRSKPYVRTPKKFPGDHCTRFRELDSAHRDEAIRRFFQEYPDEKTPEMVQLAKA